MSTLTPRRPARRALVAATALVAAALTVAPLAPSQATTTGAIASGTGTWGISTYLNSANAGRPNPLPASYTAPSTFDATSRLSTWGNATGSVAADGSATIDLAGTSVNFAPTSGAWLRIADLETTLDASGNGTVSGIVSYGLAPGTYPNITYDAAQTPQRGPTRVTLVNLSGNTATDRTLTSTTAVWSGLDGAWSSNFTDFLAGDASADPAVPGFIYAGQVSTATDRTPSPFTFSLTTATPAVTASITSASPAGGVTVHVIGDGFRAVTTTGDAGVYAGIAPSGGLPDVSTQAGMDAFAAAAYLTPGQLTTGAFTTDLVAPTANLDPAKTYSLYTWQAHTHSNTSQDTVTPLAIDFSKLATPTPPVVAAAPAPSHVAASWVKKPKVKKVGKLRVSVSAAAAVPAGSVMVTLTKKKKHKTVTTGLASDGSALIRIPKLKKVGKWHVVISYTGSSTVAASQLAITVRSKR